MAGVDNAKLSAKDIRLLTLRKAPGEQTAPGPATSDPIADANMTKRQAIAATILDSTQEELEAQRLAARNTRTEQEIRQEELAARRDEMKSGGGKSSDFALALMEEMKELRAQVSAQREEMTQGQIAEMRQHVADLEGRLMAERRTDDNRSTISKAVEQIQEFRTLMAELEPKQPEVPPPPTTPSEVQLAAYTHTSDLNFKKWEIVTERDHQLRLAEIEKQREEIKERLALERDRAAQMDRFISDTAPKLVDLGKLLIDRLVVGASAQAVAGDVIPGEPPVAPQIAPVVPEGAIAKRCASCGAVIIYRPGWPGVICQTCGQEYGETEEKPADDATGKEGQSAAS